MLYFSDVSDVLLQSIFKLNDDEKLSTSITISESQLVIMVKFCIFKILFCIFKILFCIFKILLIIHAFAKKN